MIENIIKDDNGKYYLLLSKVLQKMSSNNEIIEISDHNIII